MSKRLALIGHPVDLLTFLQNIYIIIIALTCFQFSRVNVFFAKLKLKRETVICKLDRMNRVEFLVKIKFLSESFRQKLNIY